MSKIILVAAVFALAGCPKKSNQPKDPEPDKNTPIEALSCEENPLNDELLCEGDEKSAGWCEYGTLAGFRGAGCPPAGTTEICVRCDDAHRTCPRPIALVASGAGGDCTFDRPILVGPSCKRSCPSRYRYSFK